jgi:translation initiation factor IF-3
MTMVLAPHRGAKTRAKAAHDADAPAAQRASAQPSEAQTDTPQN